jgi:hypothetical protein
MKVKVSEANDQVLRLLGGSRLKGIELSLR